MAVHARQPVFGHALAVTQADDTVGLGAQVPELAQRSGVGDALAQGAGRVTGTTFLGSIQRVQLRWNDLDLLAESSSASIWEMGQNVDIAVSAQDCAWVQA